MKSQLCCGLSFGLVLLTLFIVVPLLLVYTQLQQLGDLDTIQTANQDAGEVINVCPTMKFPCSKRTSESSNVICIDRHKHCDGTKDCPNGEDEERCVDISPNVIDHHSRAAIRQSNGAILAAKGPARYHLNCSFDDLVDGLCPCYTQHNETIICKNSNLTAIPVGLSDTIRILNLEFNAIEVIDSHVINQYGNLSVVSFRGNKLTRIESETFQSLSKLKRLYLANNLLDYIHPEAFSGLSSLTKIYLGSNRLHHLDLHVFAQTRRLNFIDLSGNLLTTEHQSFPRLESLTWLDLSNNLITVVDSLLLRQLFQLRTLTLSSNEIQRIDVNAFSNHSNLTELDLGLNHIRSIHSRTFVHLRNLKKLDLSGNLMSELPVALFHSLINLKSLNLTHVLINNIDKRHFSANKKLTHIYFKKFRYCMFAPRVRVCRPHNDGLSSTQHLLFHQILKKSVWLVALVTCSGNIIVFAWRSISTKEDAILALFVQNLSAADFLMGIYLLAIGLNDLAYEGNYSQHALQWMSSWQCSFIGFLAMLSSELSVLIVTLITIERYRCITANFRVVTPPSAKINLIAAWMLSSLMAAYPLLHWSTTGHNVFYGSSGLCFPLHIDDPFTTGWEYSAVVFLGINFPAVMIIIYLYIRMFLTIKADRKLSRPFCQETKREDAVLAARLFFIVFTDCLCWLPIIVIKIIAFLEYPINPAINAWLIVFVLPVNSALNPIIYTLAAPTELHRKLYKNIRNSFRIMKCQFVFSPRPSNCKQANEQVFSSSSTDTSNQTRSSRISSNGSVVLSMATINTNGTQAPFSLVYNSRTAPLTA